jgi:erythromycin esterase-like protein
MWRNTVVVEFIEWLRAHNDSLPPGAEKVGFYGLDLYSLHASMKAVLQYLEKVDPEAAARARERYSCFDHVGEDTQAYGLMTRLNLSRSCEEEVVGQLVELQRRAADYARRDGRLAEDDLFYAEQNARLVKNAEAYYRSMFLEETSSRRSRRSRVKPAFSCTCQPLLWSSTSGPIAPRSRTSPRRRCRS